VEVLRLPRTLTAALTVLERGRLSPPLRALAARTRAPHVRHGRAVPRGRRYRLGPIIGKAGASTGGTDEQRAARDRGELVAGAQIGVKRQDSMLLYTTVDEQSGSGWRARGMPSTTMVPRLRRCRLIFVHSVNLRCAVRVVTPNASWRWR
jgi:hypothetical protein